MILDNRNTGLLLRQDTVEHNAPDVTTTGYHALPLDKGSGREHPRVGFDLLVNLLPVLQRAGSPLNRGMGHHPKNALLEFTIEPVHDREHDDQYRNAQHQANH